MRISVVFVAVTIMAMPVSASAACMSFGEARHQFGAVHLYWHGASHCWDASPGRGHYVASAERHVRGPAVREVQPKWREARSELVADNEPAQPPRQTANRPVATPDAPPIRMMPVRVTSSTPESSISDSSARRAEAKQAIPDHSINFRSSLAPDASDHKRDITPVVRGVALFVFGFGLVLTFAALLLRSGTSATGPPLTDDASPPSRRFAAQADDTSPLLRTDRDDVEAELQSSTVAPPALMILGKRGLGTVRRLAVDLMSHQANAMRWIALRWGRQAEGFLSHGAYPIEVKWSPASAGAMISRDDVSPPFTPPSRLLEETRQAASRAVSPPKTPRPPTRRVAPDPGDAVETS